MNKDNSDNKVLLKEFSEFITSDSVTAPPNLSNQILGFVSSDLNPSPWKVFTKASLIQAVTGFIVLLFCPQFGLSITGIHGIMHILMQYGEGVCMFGCGALFVGSSLFVSSLVLKAEEVRVLRRNRTLQTALLSLLTIGAFLCLGGEVIGLVTLAWFAGSILGGIGTLELGWTARRWIRSKVIYG